MFSGIVETLGTVRARTPGRIEILPRTAFAHLELGESIAVNGACLTVATVDGHAFAADVMPETLHRTTLGELTEGATVNLERALKFGDRVGGHTVSGHVDFNRHRDRAGGGCQRPLGDHRNTRRHHRSGR